MKRLIWGLCLAGVLQGYIGVGYGEVNNAQAMTSLPQTNVQNPPLSLEEWQAGVCIIANQGVYTAVVERQNGTTKSQTKKLLDNDLKKLKTSFTNTKFIQGIEMAWYRALDDIYQLPIQKDAQSKQIFVSGITEEAFISCMNNVGNY